ncbi:DegV family protein [Spiroplasma cantharicola]|uniref:Fatty acid-binding protein DegV n=1 Tax=Spiroplasma cantharicola TaxID=362837 RepID=A0A0M3SJI3_9MOLU|nr:DegV family protein [Spiroplasma cantharicola]ALD66784.1 fatty acid-binding protein DegV [Spiroplasma cantharicola]
MKIAVITDSSCGINDISSIKDLYLVPLMITKEDGEQIADDELFKANDFYNLNDSQLLKTSQSIPGIMMEKWDELLKDYDQVVCLLLSKGLSGQFNTCKMLSNEDNYKGKVFVVDTNGVSIILKKQVHWVLQLIKEGKNGQEISDIIEKANKDFRVFIIPKSLTQLVRGGRISKAAAGLAKFLKITPILKYNGEIDKHGKTRTFKKAIEESLTGLKHFSNKDTIDISYSRVDEETLNMVKETVIKFGFKIGFLDEMPNTITCHTGRETFALGIWL